MHHLRPIKSQRYELNKAPKKDPRGMTALIYDAGESVKVARRERDRGELTKPWRVLSGWLKVSR